MPNEAQTRPPVQRRRIVPCPNPWSSPDPGASGVGSADHGFGPGTGTPPPAGVRPNCIRGGQGRPRKRKHYAPKARPLGAGVRGQSPRMPAGIVTLADSRHPEYRRALPRSVARFIDRAAEWHWFTTHTFSRDLSPDKALRYYEVWMARLSASLPNTQRRQLRRRKSDGPGPGGGDAPELDARTRRRGKPSYVVAIEWTRGGRVHLHSVISEDRLVASRRTRWARRWESLGPVCGMARIELPRGRASDYLAKEIGKGGVFCCGGPFARAFRQRRE